MTFLQISIVPSFKEVSQTWLASLKLGTIDICKNVTFFPNLNKFTLHYVTLCTIYKGICSCGESYIGETTRNVEERWSEHNSTDNKSEPPKHLADNEE